MKACHSSRRAISAFIHRAATAKKSMKSRTKTKNQSRKLKNEGKITDYFNSFLSINCSTFLMNLFKRSKATSLGPLEE